MRWMSMCAAAALLAGCSTGSGDDGDGASIVVELLEPGRLSTVLPEFATALSPSGDTLYFNRTPSDRSSLDLYVSVRGDEGWGEPTRFGPTLDWVAIDPFVSLDGRRLYFSSDNPSEGDGSSSFGLWYAERTADGWARPMRLPAPVDSDSSDVYTSFTREGELVFSSRRQGVRRIYQTRESADGWSTPIPITFGDSMDGSNPAISPDGSLLVFAAEGVAGLPDLWVVCRAEEGWGNPKVLPSPINTEFREFAPSIWGERLFFTSERPGLQGPVPDSIRPPGDLYRTDLVHASHLCDAAAS